MNAIILGLNSDIAKHLASSLKADGWNVFGTCRETCDFRSNEEIDRVTFPSWDLLICAIGDLQPIGPFSAIHPDDWEENIRVNALGPLRMLHNLLCQRRPDATAVFFSGTNPAKTNPGYSAYSSAKALLHRAVEEINAEIPDLKVVTLVPGFVRTKIHIHDVSDRPDDTTYEQIYDSLKYIVSGAKSFVGARVYAN